MELLMSACYELRGRIKESIARGEKVFELDDIDMETVIEVLNAYIDEI